MYSLIGLRWSYFGPKTKILYLTLLVEGKHNFVHGVLSFWGGGGMSCPFTHRHYRLPPPLSPYLQARRFVNFLLIKIKIPAVLQNASLRRISQIPQDHSKEQ